MGALAAATDVAATGPAAAAADERREPAGGRAGGAAAQPARPATPAGPKRVLAGGIRVPRYGPVTLDDGTVVRDTGVVIWPDGTRVLTSCGHRFDQECPLPYGFAYVISPKVAVPPTEDHLRPRVSGALSCDP